MIEFLSMWVGGLSKQITVAKVVESSSKLSSITWAIQLSKLRLELSATAEPGSILAKAKLLLM